LEDRTKYAILGRDELCEESRNIHGPPPSSGT
jgi:hypothetical protein